jgi:lantibiotic modifying enzyme
MDASLYGGSSGVALFLAETFARTREPRFRRAAVGAMQRGLDHARRRSSRFGLYNGRIGIVVAAVRVARLCDDDRLLQRARITAMACTARLPSNTRFDVIAGVAGAAAGILVIAKALDDPRLTDVARQLGQRLLDGAARGSRGWSWGDAATRDGEPHLTGFAHGAAGVSWCLGELYAAFGEPVFLEAALHAVEYEDSWYRDDAQNWADLRDHDPDSGELSFGMGWCAGAPGVGLSRIRLMCHSGDERLRRDAMRAIRVCKQALADLRPARGFDNSLCHGRMGLCELLLEASRNLNDGEAGELVRATVSEAVARYGDRPADWPCSVARGLNPSLLLGTAGIGHFMLRVAFEDVPSVLLIRDHGSTREMVSR